MYRQKARSPRFLCFTLPDPSGGVPIGLSLGHGQPGSELEWFRDLKFPQVYRCSVTNYAAAPVLQVVIRFKIEYQEVCEDVSNPSCASSGNVVYTQEWPVLISKIDAGKSNAAIFYIYNQSRCLTSVSPPRVASYIALGEKTPQEAELFLIGMVAGMSLWPVEQRKPPAPVRL
jgi:hypothetical protein